MFCVSEEEGIHLVFLRPHGLFECPTSTALPTCVILFLYTVTERDRFLQLEIAQKNPAMLNGGIPWVHVGLRLFISNGQGMPEQDSVGFIFSCS